MPDPIGAQGHGQAPLRLLVLVRLGIRRPAHSVRSDIRPPPVHAGEQGAPSGRLPAHPFQGEVRHRAGERPGAVRGTGQDLRCGRGGGRLPRIQGGRRRLGEHGHPRSCLDVLHPPGSTIRGMSLLAIDAGTTGVTVLVVDQAGFVRSKGYREFPLSFPRPGWVEHDPEHWWTAMTGATAEALNAASLEASELAAIGITNQRETTLVWDRRTMAPIHPAIVWQDRRTAPLCDLLRQEGWEARIREPAMPGPVAWCSGRSTAIWSIGSPARRIT